MSIGRLTWHHASGEHYDVRELARSLSHPIYDVDVLCDSNIFIAPIDQAFWDTLFAKTGRIVLPPSVARELNQQWLAFP
jgi:hypothetical protein